MSTFLDLHVPGDPLLLPNAWDSGSARLMESLGARAIATTSSGFAATLGRPDGGASRAEVLAHAAALVDSVSLPVSADLEAGYAETLDEVAETCRLAARAGLAGASIEDWSDERPYALAEAVDRVVAAREAAPGLVLTARADGYFHGNPSLSDAIARLQAYAEAGANVLYAPGLTDLIEIRTLVGELPQPVNVLLLPGLSVPGLADAGVARISVGGGLAWTTWNAAATATREFLSGGSAWLTEAGAGRTEAARVVG